MTPEKEYQTAYRLAEALRRDFAARIQAAIKQLGDPHLVRATVDEPRIKALESLQRKATEKGWSLPEAITNACDFIGFRIVCNNLQDVERAADLIQQTLEQDGTRVTRVDYIRRPRRSGYRAVQLRFSPTVAIASESMQIGCEVQIRTRLQDSWGELSRADIYKNQSALPRRLHGKMERLAKLWRAPTASPTKSGSK